MGLFSLPKIDSDLTARFILDGKEYEMSQFSKVSDSRLIIKVNRKTKSVAVECLLF